MPLRSDAPAEAAGVDPGLPAPCGRCGGPGFLDLIDVRRRRQHEHCVDCGATWTRPIPVPARGQPA